MRYLFLLVFVFTQITLAHAGDFYEKDGFAIGGYDPVSFFEEKGPQLGLQSISTQFKESTFLFSSEAHKSDFLKNPEKFSPQYNGFCAFGVAGGYKAKTEPEAYTVVNQKLYFNYSLAVQKKWRQNRDKLIDKAEQNWPSVQTTTKVHQ